MGDASVLLAVLIEGYRLIRLRSHLDDAGAPG